MTTKRPSTPPDPAGALTWFAELWLARQSGDREREAIAKRQLRDQGIDVLIDSDRFPLAAAAGAPRKGRSA